jgi:hypothetical protein
LKASPTNTKRRARQASHIHSEISDDETGKKNLMMSNLKIRGDRERVSSPNKEECGMAKWEIDGDRNCLKKLDPDSLISRGFVASGKASCEYRITRKLADVNLSLLSDGHNVISRFPFSSVL